MAPDAEARCNFGMDRKDRKLGEPPVPVPQHLSEAKERSILEGQKTYIAINGAGAAALLAFLQAIWANESAAPIRVWVLCGILSFAVGVVAGALTFPFRHRAFVTGASDSSKFLYRLVYFYLPGIAITAFLLGLLLPVMGAFFALSSPAPKSSTAVTQPASPPK